MPEIEIFADPLSANVWAWVPLIAMAAQVEIIVYIVRRMPCRLPVSIIRRAL